MFHALNGAPGLAWLDGGDADCGWSVLAWAPDDVCRDTTGWLDTARRWSRARGDQDAPFTGGVLGYLGYGVGHTVAPVPLAPSTDEPDLWLGRYPGALCFNHANQRWVATGTAAFERDATRLLRGVTQRPTVASRRDATRSQTVDADAYRNAVKQILKLIYAGDCYQVNLSRPVWVDGVDDPIALWFRLRASGAPAYGAWIAADQSIILCHSPELLLAANGGQLRSQPIKGTIKRHLDAAADADAATFLATSAKDRAELAMIVDLVRNDLGRVAVPGSVTVGPRDVRPHAAVHHAATDVFAALSLSCDLWDALSALLPIGSVTGAPKVRACQRIAELEAHPRGAYCGTIGFASGDQAVFNVAIRTGVWRDATLRYHVGGGIVADSTPEGEWAETVDKAAAWAAAVGSAPPPR